MKTLSANLTTHIAQQTTTMAEALLVTRLDGQVVAYTSHDRDVVLSGVTYKAAPGLLVSGVTIAAGLAVGNLQLTTLHDGTLFTTADILDGVWRNAAFSLFRFNWVSPTDGVDTLLSGSIGEVSINLNTVVAELLDLRQYLQQPVGSPSTKLCRYRLGGTKCRVRLDPPTWAATTAYTVRTTGDAAAGSVVKPTTLNNRHFKCTTAGTSGGTEPAWNTTIGGTTTDNTVTWTTIQALTVTGTLTSATDNQVFRDSARAEAVDFFMEGEFTFSSGVNNGISAKIKSYAADGTFTLMLPVTRTVAGTETYTAVAGCTKRLAEDCVTKFDNVLNFGGEPHRPGIDAITQNPTVSV